MNKFTINLHRWITAVLLLSLSPSIFAQGNEDVLGPCYSFWYNYNNIREKTSHVRSDHDYRVIHTQYRNLSSDIMVHTFAILRYSTNVENHFTTTFGAIEPSDPTVDINDMEIYNGICYFCGTKTFNSPNPNYTIPVQKGIVGCFSISAMYSGLGSLVTYEVPGTTQLTRLAISCPSQQLAQINAIGIMDDFSSSCMVEIRENSSTSWTATLDYLPSIPKIHFSDILATHNSIILLSQLKCANDHFYGADDYDINHQKFLLDRFSWNGCHDDCTASYTTHYMAHYQLNTYENYYFHYNKAPMALSRLAYDWFSVAFGVIKNGSGSGGIRFFPFQNIWQYDSSIYYPTGKYPAVTEMTNIDLTLETHILSTDNSNPNGIIANPCLSDPPITVNTITTPGPKLNSLTHKTSTSYLEITGHDTQNNLNLFEQDVSSFKPKNCLIIGTKDPIILSEQTGALYYVEWQFLYYNEGVVWEEVATFEMGKTEVETVCKRCPEDH